MWAHYAPWVWAVGLAGGRVLIWQDLKSDLELGLRVLFHNLCFKELRTGFCRDACFQVDYGKVCRAHLLCAQLCGWKLCAGAGMWAGHSCDDLVKAVVLSYCLSTNLSSWCPRPVGLSAHIWERSRQKHSRQAAQAWVYLLKQILVNRLCGQWAAFP